MPVSDALDEILTPADLEREFKLKLGTQKTLRHRRQLPFIRLGGRIVRYRRSEINKWLAAQTVAVASVG